MTEKQALRLRARGIAEGMTARERAENSAAIRDRALALEAYRQARTVFLYVSMPAEPDTAALIGRALADGKRVCVPRCQKPPRMEAAEIRSRQELRPGRLGIPAPGPEAKAVPPEEIDLALIPCVAAGRDGSRLGHGGGYYDAFLPETRAKKICLCFEKLLTDGIPMDETDVGMDAVITEAETYAE